MLNSPTNDLFAFGLTPLGLVDSTFGVNGSFRVVATQFSALLDVQCSDADGSCRLIGHSRSNDTSRVVVVKLTDNGLLDPGYANAGIGSYLSTADGAFGYASTVQDDGKLLVAGLLYGSGPFALRVEDDLSTAIVPPAPLARTLLDLRFDAHTNAWWLHLPESTGATRIEVIDALGRTAHDQRHGTSNSWIQLPTTSLAPGSYLVRATQHGRTSVGRIFVSR